MPPIPHEENRDKATDNNDDNAPYPWNGWGRCVIYVSNVDAMHAKAVNAGLHPEFEPRDAAWGERYFHIRDPMGHELSFARRIDGHQRWK